jgi:NAD(P)-dependent dehydrogenase (short-subunit alcohol dehydrogenase family)
MTAGRVAGKRALVTGAAQGLGAATAWMLAREGALVALSDIAGDAVHAVAEAICDELGAGRAFAFQHDVRDDGQWRDVVDQAAVAMGGLSVLVNNAGVVITGTVDTLDHADWTRSMQINADSVFLGCKRALPVMRQTQPGSIVNISSIAALIASHNFASYNASKAAVWMLTKSVALQCARERSDIRCNSIHPAFVQTPILEDLVGDGDRDTVMGKLAKQVPIGRLGQPSDVAYAVLYLASDESRFMTGAELKLDGGISAM